jgi:aminopeptidase 2
MQDIYMPIGGLRSHPEGIERRWEWLCDNWKEIVKRLPPGLTMLSSVVSMCAGGFTRRAQLEKVQSFFKDKDTKVSRSFCTVAGIPHSNRARLKGFDRSLEQCLDSIRARDSWLQRDAEDVKSWLQENGYFGKSQGKL